MCSPSIEAKITTIHRLILKLKVVIGPSREEMEDLGCYGRWEPFGGGGLGRARAGQKEIHHGADQQGAERGTQTRRRNLSRKEIRQGGMRKQREMAGER